MRVPKRDAGTDHSVVAMKGGNALGAKGMSQLKEGSGQPDYWEEPYLSAST